MAALLETIRPEWTNDDFCILAINAKYFIPPRPLIQAASSAHPGATSCPCQELTHFHPASLHSTSVCDHSSEPCKASRRKCDPGTGVTLVPLTRKMGQFCALPRTYRGVSTKGLIKETLIKNVLVETLTCCKPCLIPCSV